MKKPLSQHPEYHSLINIQAEGKPVHPNYFHIAPSTQQYDRQFVAYVKETLGQSLEGYEV